MRSPARGNKLMFFLTLWFFGASLIMGLIMILFGLEDQILLSLALSQIVGLFIPFVFYLIITKQRQRQVLKWRSLGVRNTILTLVITLAAFPIVNLISHLSSFVFVPAIDLITVDITAYPFWISLIIVAAFPALFEEFMFRGALYHEYEGVSIHKAAIVTGLFFGIIHLNFHQSIYAGAMGILMAYLLYFTRSIWAPILMHFFHNGLATALAYIPMAEPVEENPLTTLLVFGGLSLVMVPVLIVCFKKLKPPVSEEVAPSVETSEEPQPEEPQKVFTWGFWATIGLFIFFAGLMEIVLRMGE